MSVKLNISKPEDYLDYFEDQFNDIKSGMTTLTEFVDDMILYTNKVKLLTARQLLKECLAEQQEIISSPLRFNGVHIERIKEVFRRNGIIHENEF